MSKMLRSHATDESDLDFVMAAQAKPEISSWITCWSHDEHLASFGNPDIRHITYSTANEPVAFVILAGLQNINRSIEFARIAVAEPGKGIGRTILEEVIDLAFGELNAHRLWLDVSPHNERALRAYRKAGFVGEGVLRECQLFANEWESLIIMSILEQERSG